MSFFIRPLHTSPAQWGALSIGAEDVPVHAIEWSVIDDNSPRLAAGQTLTGMSIKLDKTDVSYVSGRATVYSGYPVAPISVPIQKLDTTPPRLNRHAHPRYDYHRAARTNDSCHRNDYGQG